LVTGAYDRRTARPVLARSAAFRCGAGRGDWRLARRLMARLGHSTPAAAMRYQHITKGRDREIAALLSKLADS